MHRELMATKLLEQSRLLSQKALYAMQRGDLQEADRLLVQALRTCPTDVEARSRYARVLWECGKRDEALRQLQMALSTAPDNPDLHIQMAEFLLELGRLDQASHHAGAAVTAAPKNPGAWLIEGRVALARNEPDQALAAFYRVLGFRPGDREALRWVSQAYRVKRDWEQVLAVQQRILQRYSPGEEPAEELAVLAEAYYHLGRLADAASTYVQASQKAAQPTPYLTRAAECYAQAGNLREAERLARQVLAVEPQNAIAQRLASLQNGTAWAGRDLSRR